MKLSNTKQVAKFLMLQCYSHVTARCNIKNSHKALKKGDFLPNVTMLQDFTDSEILCYNVTKNKRYTKLYIYIYI